MSIKYTFTSEEVEKAKAYIHGIKYENKCKKERGKGTERENKIKKRRGDLSESSSLYHTKGHCNVHTVKAFLETFGTLSYPKNGTFIAYQYSKLRNIFTKINNHVSRHEWNEALKLIRYILTTKSAIVEGRATEIHRPLYRVLIIILLHHPQVDIELIHKVIKIMVPNQAPDKFLKDLLKRKSEYFKDDSDDDSSLLLSD